MIVKYLVSYVRLQPMLGVALSYSILAYRERNGLESRSWWPWVVCLSAGLFFFYEFLQLHLLDVINQPLRDEFRMDAKTLSWVSSAFVWANTLFLLPAGFILDRFPARHVILIALSTCAVGVFGFSLAQSTLVVAFFRAVTGASNAFCFLSAVVLVSRWFPPKRQAFVVGCIVTMALIGGVVAHTPVACVVAKYGWRQTMHIDALLGFFLVAWVAAIVQDKTTSQKSSQPTSASPASSFFAAVQNKQNWLAGLYTACLNLPIMVLCALWGASYLQTVYHLSPLSASNVVSVILLGSIVGSPAAGWISDQLGQRKAVMLIGAILSGLSLLPLFSGVALSEASLSALFFLLGFFTSTQVITYPLVAETNDSASTGIAMGIASTIIMGGAGLAQVVFGYVLQRFAGDNVMQYVASDFRAAIWLLPIAFLVALLASVLIREPQGLISSKQDV